MSTIRKIGAGRPTLKGYAQEVYDRLWKQRNTNPRWEMVWGEMSRVDIPAYTPVVEGTMTILPDGSLAYLFDAGTPHPRDPRRLTLVTDPDKKKVATLSKCLQEWHAAGGWDWAARELVILLRSAIRQARSEAKAKFKKRKK